MFLVVFMLPFSDVIAGKMYLKYLCATQTGHKVYQNVELPLDYWSADGSPKYLAPNGFVDMSLLPDKYEWNIVDEPYLDFLLKISKVHWQLIDPDTQAVIGERITYMRHFGWLNRFSPAPNIGAGCKYSGGQKDRDQEQAFFKDIFKPITLTR